jgi:hypothetical protein
MLRRYTRQQLAAHASARPSGYLAEFMQAAVAQDVEGVTFDTEHPTYVALTARHQGEPTSKAYYRASAGQPATAPPTPRPSPRPATPIDRHELGPRLWGELHARPRASDGGDGEFLRSLARRLPCGECRDHFQALINQRRPPEPLTFEWTWWAHNQVNRRLGKAEMPLAEARRLHGYEPTEGEEGTDRRACDAASIDS